MQENAIVMVTSHNKLCIHVYCVIVLCIKIVIKIVTIPQIFDIVIK